MRKRSGGKMRKVMHEFKHGSLRRGTGRPGKKDGKVTSRAQAIAIGLSEQRKAGERTAKRVQGKGKGRGAGKAAERRLAGVPV